MSLDRPLSTNTPIETALPHHAPHRPQHLLRRPVVAAPALADPPVGTDHDRAQAVRDLAVLLLGEHAEQAGHALDLLSKTLAAVERNYDYVIVDSPPFYGKLTDTGLFATRNVLVPALTEASSERAIELLIEQLTALEDHVGITIDTLGVVANRVEQTNEDQVMLDWLGEVFADYPIWQVRKRVALQRAFSAGQSVFRYQPSLDITDVFLDIATEFDRTFGYTEVTA